MVITDVRVHPGDSGFLLDDGQTAILYDSGFAFTGFAMADNIKAVLGQRPLDYIFLTHSHYDHALGSVYIRKYWPDVKIVAGEYAQKIFEKPSARALMRELDQKIAARSGIENYDNLIDELYVDIPVKDGDTVQCGAMNFTAISLPGHTKCCFGFYLAKEKLLLGCESLGVYDGAETVVPACLVGYQMALDSIEKARRLEIDQLLSPHLGLLTKEQTAFYLENGIKSTVATAQGIAAILRSGGSKDECFAWFKARFYRDCIPDMYPPDAMELNTRIMIDRIEKELCT